MTRILEISREGSSHDGRPISHLRRLVDDFVEDIDVLCSPIGLKENANVMAFACVEVDLNLISRISNPTHHSRRVGRQSNTNEVDNLAEAAGHSHYHAVFHVWIELVNDKLADGISEDVKAQYLNRNMERLSGSNLPVNTLGWCRKLVEDIIFEVLDVTIALGHSWCALNLWGFPGVVAYRTFHKTVQRALTVTASRIIIRSTAAEDSPVACLPKLMSSPHQPGN